MPIYQCSAPRGVLSDAMKRQIAAAITDAHVGATAAPPSFVHVFFHELPPGGSYTAGQLDTEVSWITGAIRAGRPLEIKQKLIKEISAAWSEMTGQPQKHLQAGLTEVDPDVTMEFGPILPHLGEESDWFARNKETLGGISSTGI